VVKGAAGVEEHHLGAVVNQDVLPLRRHVGHVGVGVEEAVAHQGGVAEDEDLVARAGQAPGQVTPSPYWLKIRR